MSHGHEPAEAKRLSQDVRPSGAPVWRQVRAMWMARGIYLKISQNEQARWVLLATGNAPLIEDDPRDAVWGTVPTCSRGRPVPTFLQFQDLFLKAAVAATVNDRFQ